MAILGSMGLLTWGWSPMLQFARLYISACSNIHDQHSSFFFFLLDFFLSSSNDYIYHTMDFILCHFIALVLFCIVQLP